MNLVRQLVYSKPALAGFSLSAATPARQLYVLGALLPSELRFPQSEVKAEVFTDHFRLPTAVLTESGDKV